MGRLDDAPETRAQVAGIAGVGRQLLNQEVYDSDRLNAHRNPLSSILHQQHRGSPGLVVTAIGP